MHPPAPGLHLTVVRLNDGRPLLDGSVIGLGGLLGLELVLDGNVDLGLLERSRAVRVEIDVPWPDSEATPWFTGQISGTFTVTLDGALKGDGSSIFWVPNQSTTEWLRGQLFKGLERTDRREVTARVVVDGWSVLELSNAEVRRPLNCHVDVFVADGRALLQLPTDDATPAGRFVLGFRLQPEAEPWTFTVPDVHGQSSGSAVRRMNNVGFTTMIQFEIALGARQGTVLRTDPPPGTQLPEGSQVTLVVATRRRPLPDPPVPAPPNG